MADKLKKPEEVTVNDPYQVSGSFLIVMYFLSLTSSRLGSFPGVSIHLLFSMGQSHIIIHSVETVDIIRTDII